MTRTATHLVHTSALAAAVRARLERRHALVAAVWGIGAAAVVALRRLVWSPLEVAPQRPFARVGVEVLLALAGAVAAAAIGWWIVRRSPPAVGRVIEGAVPTSRNLLFTALELSSMDGDANGADPVRSAVFARAEALAATVSAEQVVPNGQVYRRLGAVSLAWVVAVALTLLAPTGSALRAVQRAVALGGGAPTVSRVDVRVVPPAYAALDARALRDPTRVEALEGSALTFTMATNADSVRLETADRTFTLSRGASGEITWPTTLRADGFVAVTPFTTTAGARRLIALAMQRDAQPTVRIAAPGKDLMLASADRTLDVRIQASDDIGLGTLQLHYTKVSGSGERFTFSEGTVPVQLSRASRETWTARAALALRTLLSEPGDVVVYRARVTDTRPGRAPVESDAYLAQLVEPGGVAALGFSMDPDEDRYAVSQQMVIQKTEQLIAAQARIAGDTVRERAAQIATEQRRVRAEFVFMTGGEFEAGVVESEEGATQLDEAAEADAEQDLAAGRMVNRGRQALLTAIRAMSRAAIALTEQRLADALGFEKTALRNLQEAFARQRFLMRALSQREALDPTRRHSGAADSLARGVLAIGTAERDATRDALRPLVSALLRVDVSARDAGARLTELAVRVLQVRAADPRAQRIAGWLSAAGTQPASAAARRDSAATALNAWIAAAQPGERAAPTAAAVAQRRALDRSSR